MPTYLQTTTTTTVLPLSSTSSLSIPASVTYSQAHNHSSQPQPGLLRREKTLQDRSRSMSAAAGGSMLADFGRSATTAGRRQPLPPVPYGVGPAPGSSSSRASAGAGVIGVGSGHAASHAHSPSNHTLSSLTMSHAHTQPHLPSLASGASIAHHHHSHSAASKSTVTLMHPSHSSPSGALVPAGAGPPGVRRSPIVYPALLSRVAEAFRARISLSPRGKDGLEYKDAFDGREAVDKIAYIIKTTDRNLALLLGRALDAQKFFHDVTYDHRLRDSPNELYQFRTGVPSPFVSGDDVGAYLRGSADGADERDVDQESTVTPKKRTKTQKRTNTRPHLTPHSSGSNNAESLQGSSTSSSTDSHTPPGHDDDEYDDEDGPPSPTVQMSQSHSSRKRGEAGSASGDDTPLPVGVFTLLTDCYSPTCSRDRLCYSISCPRRVEQQRRLHMRPHAGLTGGSMGAAAGSSAAATGAEKTASRRKSMPPGMPGPAGLAELDRDSTDSLALEDLRVGATEPGTLWIHSVPQEVVDNVSDTEKKRQEAINEVMYTERDFVKDMEYLRDLWMTPLLTQDILPEERRQPFVKIVFGNIEEIIAVNTKLRDALNKRQKAYAVVESIGDILLDHVRNFEPFVKYGSNQLYGKYEFEKEKNSNPTFAAFVEETERRPESRKLELNGYLTKPTTRLARYPLLLDVVLKYTPDDNADKAALPMVIGIVREFLERVNVETGKTENKFNLFQLDQQLVFRPGEAVDLRLSEPTRELIYKGAMRRRGGSVADSGDLQVFLFDHALLMVKQKSKHEQFKVFRRPIPLELLVISAPDEVASNNTAKPPTTRGKVSLVKRNSFSKQHRPTLDTQSPVRTDNKGGFPITFVHLGRKGYNVTLYAATYVARKKWIEFISKQQELVRGRSMIFDTTLLSDGFFMGPTKVNCAVPYDNGRRVAYGSDDGVYLAVLQEPEREPVKVLDILDVAQIDVLEEYQLLVVLSERSVITFPLDALDSKDPTSGLKRAKRISSHTNFFKAGTCLGRTLVCVVKTSPLSSTIKTMEPIDQSIRGKNKPTFRKLLQGGNDTLKLYKEFYIPLESSSIHFLNRKLCVGCTKGFEIVDLETLDTQGLLDPYDQSLDFVQKRETVRPMAIYRVDNDFLLCYDEFAFYVNKTGWRARPKIMIFWEGAPTAFALHYPYVLAFDPTFIEIRHVETGLMVQVVQGNNLRCLFADNPPSTTNTASPAYSSSHYPSRTPFGVSQPHALYDSRQSLSYSQYSFQGLGYAPQAHGHDRDEIIMVSDDRVMALRLASAVDPSASTSSSSLPPQQQQQQQPVFPPHLQQHPQQLQPPLPPLPLAQIYQQPPQMIPPYLS